MADSKTSQLPAAGALTGAELLHLVQGGNSRQASLDLIKALFKTGFVADDIDDFSTAVKSRFSPGSGISISYNSITGVTTISCSISEIVDDRVAALLQAGDNITLTYNDAAGTLTIASTATASLPVGAVVGSAYAEYTANADLTAATPIDDTIPQVGEGTQVLSAAITPTATANKVVGSVSGSISSASNSTFFIHVHVNGSPNAIATLPISVSAGFVESFSFEFWHLPASTSAQTYTVRFGGNATARLNGTPTARYAGSTAKTSLTLYEVKG